MKIQHIQYYNQKFGNSYYSSDFLTNKKRPNEVELVEKTVKKYTQTGETISLYYVFSKIGKIFEDHDVYDKAIEFYQKAKDILKPNSKAYKTKSENTDFDICRARNKTQFNDN